MKLATEPGLHDVMAITPSPFIELEDSSIISLRQSEMYYDCFLNSSRSLVTSIISKYPTS
jgi:hypothetical protein